MVCAFSTFVCQSKGHRSIKKGKRKPAVTEKEARDVIHQLNAKRADGREQLKTLKAEIGRLTEENKK